MEYFKLGKVSAAPMGLVLHANTVPPLPQGATLFRPLWDGGSNELRPLVFGLTGTRLDKYAGDAV